MRGQPVLGIKGAHSPFSNFYDSPFMHNGTHYWTSECGDDVAHNMILNATTQHQAKKIGSRLKNFNITLWENNGKDMVYHGIKAKFEQNQQLCDILLQTL